MPHTEDLLIDMRSGRPQTPQAIRAFIDGVVSQQISRPQAAAWLAWAFARGLSDDETVALTHAMTHSGTVLQWSEGPKLIDKHSTGGVGDKVSLILAPLWVELGWRVPMISGRGLGHTGGTLDKLEAIPGFQTQLPEREFRRILDCAGAFLGGQTETIAPADRILYALRNEIQAVESIPLIVASILSKKLAEGLDRLVLDVKTGSGAFMENPHDAKQLAITLVRVAQAAGLSCTAHITAMDRPLGKAVGNSLEVEEALACLRGEGPSDISELVCFLAEHPDAKTKLSSGAAYERFERIVFEQGGDLEAFRRRKRVAITEIIADKSGVIEKMDARGIGKAAFVLGAGRRRTEDPVDFEVGLEFQVSLGESVIRGQPLVKIHHREQGFDEAKHHLNAALTIGVGGQKSLPLLLETIGG